MNFEFIRPFRQLAPLYQACAAAEALVPVAPAQSCGSARSALEFIVRFIYDAVGPESDVSPTLFEMLSSSAFTSYVNDEGLITAMHVVRKNGNCGAHGGIISVQTARETLEQLRF